jgi:hypothetical protein
MPAVSRAEIIEIITPGGFEDYFRELGELLVEHANDPAGQILHELPEFGALAVKYGLTYRTRRTGWTPSGSGTG